MELSPSLYSWLVRPKWLSDMLIKDILMDRFDFYQKNVLDFGCGVGSYCSFFSPEYYIGVDCNHKRTYYASRKHAKYSFRVLSGYKLPVQQNSMDYILIISVLHHISQNDLAGYLNEFRRVLKPNGRILIFEPCFFSNSQFSNIFMKLIDRGKHIRYESNYLELFSSYNYKTEVHDRCSQLFFYTKLLFSAFPNK
ncbi:MAG: class I SAM-dependent methyltransferase [Bacillota bacterium]